MLLCGIVCHYFTQTNDEQRAAVLRGYLLFIFPIIIILAGCLWIKLYTWNFIEHVLIGRPVGTVYHVYYEGDGLTFVRSVAHHFIIITIVGL